MNKYQNFIYKDYSFDKSSKILSLHYSFDNQLNFTETFRFNFDFADYNEQALDRTVQLVFFMAGVSYFKAYFPAKIVIERGKLDQATADFLSKTYIRGLGEFFYVNNLDPQPVIEFPVNSSALEPLSKTSENSGLLVAVGGGKDSLVSIELLRGKIENIATWSVGHQKQLTPLVERIGLPHLWVERTWDRQLLELNTRGALNGHVPISAILACVGAVAAILSGRRDIVMSNEQSANEPTLHYHSTNINHQYSKSLEFEQDFQKALDHLIGGSVRYFSLLRPFSELRIAEIFTAKDFDKYHDVFSSCNHAFTHDSDKLFWDGTCPKCAFIFLILTPFVDRSKLEALFGGKNLLLDTALEPTYRQLLGIEGDKPLECVGEVKESRAAMSLAQKIYPELSKYGFDLPVDYDFRTPHFHSMPEDIYKIILG